MIFFLRIQRNSFLMNRNSILSFFLYKDYFFNIGTKKTAVWKVFGWFFFFSSPSYATGHGKVQYMSGG